jgi:beta-galactosidase
MKHVLVIACIGLTLALDCLHAAETRSPETRGHTFALGGKDFLLDGKPFQIRSGELHPGRVPKEYWRHRLRMAKAMGLNTIAAYVFWAQHEVAEGRFDFQTWNLDLATFLQTAKEEGMWIMLRPGPYCCGEYDFGGIPVYLLRYPDLKIRTMDPRYMAAAERYLRVLAGVVRPYQVTQGGPILMVQIENEYGSFPPGKDRRYLERLCQIWRDERVTVPFYTADGADAAHLTVGMVPGGALGMDPATNEGQFALARRLGGGKVPAFCAEIYPGWLRHWGEDWCRGNDLAGPLDFFMRSGYSFNLYMFHGGTNWGFMAGANGMAPEDYHPDITSYEYGAPVDEQGRATAAYHAMRKRIAAHLPAGELLPDIPAPIPAMRIPEIAMERWTSLWDQLPAPLDTEEPKTFEAIGQNQGLMLYRHRGPLPAGKLSLRELHDYAIVMVDGRAAGTLDRRNHENSLATPANNELDVLVEGMGHINFYSFMTHDCKGITQSVTLDGRPVTGWQMFPLPLDAAWVASLPKSAAASTQPGGIFKGRFTLATVADTFIDMSRYRKGVAWVNGHNLGRYWHIGPQYRLYCPASWLKPGENEIVALDLQQTIAQSVCGMLSHADRLPEPSAGKSGDAAADHNQPRAIRHSDVVFMYDNPKMYAAYGCTVLGWAGTADARHIDEAHAAGVRLFATSIGFLTEMSRVIDFSPDFADAACRNFEGKPFVVPWLWDHKHKGQPAWWWCTNSPLYRKYLAQRLREAMAGKPDGLHVDDYRGTSGAVTWRSACFCRYCMAGFREYLRKTMPSAKLAALGIKDLDTFDYREFLRAKGVTPNQYAAQRWKAPLAGEFLDYQVQANTAFLAEYRRQAESLRGRPVTLCVNSGLEDAQSLAIAPQLSYFCCEVNHEAAARRVPLHPIYIYKLADGLDRPVAATASGQDWDYVAEHKLPGLVRSWIAQSYAFGQNLMAPHHQWCYTEKRGTHWYDGPTEEYAWLYQFIRRQARLLDGYEAIAPVAVLYDNAARRRWRGDIQPICSALAERNIPFTVAVAGDDWLAYRLDAARMSRFRAVIVPKDTAVAGAQRAVIDGIRAQGRLVVWPDDALLEQLVPCPVQVLGGEHVTVVPRVVPGNAAAPAVIHLLNRQYDADHDAMTPLTNITLRVRKDLFAGRAFSAAVLHAPRVEPVRLAVHADGDCLTVKIPRLDLWAIVELSAGDR